MAVFAWSNLQIQKATFAIKDLFELGLILVTNCLILAP